MADKFVLYLHAAHLDFPSWAVVGENGELQQSAIRDSGEGLAALAENKEVIVLVPAEDVLLITAKLPQMNRSRLIQALPFAVEDQLVGDIETLHFAPGVSGEEGGMPVAVVSIDKMRQWVGLLQSWHITADTLMPASLAVPYEANTWTIMLHDMFTMRMSSFYAFGGDINNIQSLLHLALTSTEKVPEGIYIYNTTTKAIASTLDVEVKIEEDWITAEQMMVMLAKSAAKETPLDLLQGAFSVKKYRANKNKIINWIGYLIFSWALLLFLYPTLSYFILSNEAHRLDQKITDVYKRHFPHANNVVAPKLRMQEKLREAFSKYR